MKADKDGLQQSSAMARLRDRLRKLYHGHTPAAFRFQLAAVTIDLAIIAFFIATPVLQDKPSFLWLDYSVAVLVAARASAVHFRRKAAARRYA